MSGKKSILFIHPPVSKPCEPPAGIAKLIKALEAFTIDCRVYEANLDGICHLLDRPLKCDDTWSRRAFEHLDANLLALRSKAVYASPARYKRAVADLNRVLFINGRAAGVDISLSNYSCPSLAPVRSSDLLKAAETFEDNPFYPRFESRLKALYSQREPDIVGFSVNYMSQALCAFAMAGFLKKRFPATTIVFGGGLVTSWLSIPDFRNPFTGLVDHLISGPGENALLGMCTEKATPCASFTGFDYDHFAMGNYLSPGPILPYSTSRGCYWKKCAFCPEKTEKGEYLSFGMGNVSDDIHHLNTKTAFSLIHFLDNALSPGFLLNLTTNPPGIPWYGFVRISRHLTDPDFVKKLKASGCVMLKLGIESGDQGVLDALAKGIDLKTVSRALATLKKAGITTYAYLLFGTPPETIDSARKTLQFTLTHADAIDYLNLAIFNLPAYSKEAAELTTGEFYQADLSLYREFVHPEGWNRDLVRRFLEKEFRRPAPIRSMLDRNPPFFTSSHAPFFKMYG